MAVSLKLTFDASGGKTVSMTFPYADVSADAEDVKALMDEIVDNSEIFAEPPLTAVTAEFITHTVTPIDLDELN
ncbi:MAG: DUF2922 domain-containing protein [Synergistaceae bacterium]|jgi:hypothetical protein|nr:DUF2922 domain-containing protein [Synergistaceae bacterium]